MQYRNMAYDHTSRSKCPLASHLSLPLMYKRDSERGEGGRLGERPAGGRAGERVGGRQRADGVEVRVSVNVREKAPGRSRLGERVVLFMFIYIGREKNPTPYTRSSRRRSKKTSLVGGMRRRTSRACRVPSTAWWSWE